VLLKEKKCRTFFWFTMF